MTCLARAPTFAEWLIVGLVALIPLAALVIGFLILMRIAGPPKATPDDPDPPLADPPPKQDP